MHAFIPVSDDDDDDDDDVVVEAHCYALQCRRIDFEQIRSRINQPLIADLRAETSCN